VGECEYAGCGDGYTWLGVEGCDDGNNDLGDGCGVSQNDWSDLDLTDCDLDTCVLPSGSAWEWNPNAEYNRLCWLPECGDGAEDDGEQCDDHDGGTVSQGDNEDSCNATCFFNTCRDGWEYDDVTEEWYAGPEQYDNKAALHYGDIGGCDDGNSNNWDDCTNECRAYGCGDGFVHYLVDGDHITPDPDEQCDDGNLDSTDSCIAEYVCPECGEVHTRCQWNYCGDGFHYETVTDLLNDNPTEQCDDAGAYGNDNYCVTHPGPDGRMSGGPDNVYAHDNVECVLATCGDGHIWSQPNPQELCDKWNNTTGAVNPDCIESATGRCKPNTCGDNDQDGVEECDDADGDDGDGCLTSCISAYCGDGVVDATSAEECDDMNLDESDSCIMEIDAIGQIGDVENGLGCHFAECGDGYWYTHQSPGTLNPNEVEPCEKSITWDQICGDQCEIQCMSGRLWAGEYAEGAQDEHCYFIAEDLYTFSLEEPPEYPQAGACWPVVGTWEEAREACKAYNVGADLAVITSDGENEHVKDLLMACALDQAHDEDDGYSPDNGGDWWHGQQNSGNGWLGARDISFETGVADPDGDWEWIDGTGMSYENWYTGQPNDCCLPDADTDAAPNLVDLPGQQQCLTLRAGTSEGWRDWDCYWGWETSEDRDDYDSPNDNPRNNLHFPQWAICEVSMELE
jgi:cysteine-rich repeat protein